MNHIWKTPKSIPGLTVWYDACRPGTLGAGNKVSSWPDLSGNGFHAVQQTAGNRPVWTDNSLKGRPGLVFTAVNSCSISPRDRCDVLSNDLLLVVVFSGSNTGGVVVGKLRATSAPGRYNINISSSSSLAAHVSKADGNGVDSLCSGFSYNAPTIGSLVWDRSVGHQLFRNGAAGTAQTTTNDTTSRDNVYDFAVGSCENSGGVPSSFLSGTVHEVVVVLGTDVSNYRQRLETYLSAKWGIKLE